MDIDRLIEDLKALKLRGANKVYLEKSSIAEAVYNHKEYYINLEAYENNEYVDFIEIEEV